MKSGMNGLKLAMAICVVAATATAMAQGQGRGQGRGGPFGGRGGGFGNDPTFLLGLEPVQKELTLSADQTAKITKLTDENRTAMQDLRNSGADFQEIGTKMQERAKDNKKKVAEILLKPQSDRLDQIMLQLSLQTQGPAALTAAEVADKLGLTSEQKTKLEGLVTEMGEKRREIFQNAQGDFQAIGEQTAKLNTDYKDKAVALLTADQKTKWESMTGKEFKIDPTQLRGGFGGRRGGQQN